MWDVVKSVLAAFFGVQQDQRRRKDFEQGKPGAFIIVGILLALVMVAIVFAIARMAAG
ncbi:DUF2970 domain-containing protein [Halomonas sp. PR-M31]|uniref:DUF2970 domain-containing protein n=1 Tax=Halomonas sp. PR-M31 TaxID=1471202 RepID=UPI0009E3285E|nr:DUF2970 domain-containing protein [Halomonas sp. PR-M31]